MPRKRPTTPDPSGKTPKKRSRRTPAKKATPEAAEAPAPATSLVPQPHGGALRVGNPGNKGGGRKPEAFRQLARDILADHNLLERIARIASGLLGEIHHRVVRTDEGISIEVEYTEAPARDQIKAVELLAKLGVGFQTAITDSEGGALTVFVAAGGPAPEPSE